MLRRPDNREGKGEGFNHAEDGDFRAIARMEAAYLCFQFFQPLLVDGISHVNNHMVDTLFLLRLRVGG